MAEKVFSALSGREELCARLSALSASGRVPHALLLESRDAALARDAAHFLAQTLLCTAPGEQRPCLTCPACRKAAAGSHPDIREISGGDGPRSFHVDAIREIRSDAFILPNESDCKIYLLLGAQSMSEQAQNALLKVLEEPPASVRFILTCDARTHLLETILSRCAVLPLDAPGAGEQPPQDEKALALALSLARAIPAAHEYELMQATGPLEKDKNLLRACLKELTLLVRDAFILRAGGRSLLSGQEEAAQLLCGALTQSQLIALLDAVHGLLTCIDRNANNSLLLTRLCSTLRHAAGR